MKIVSATFAGSSTRVAQKPARRLPEYAFIGRSNVGKSSLINYLCGNSRLAMTSSKPGKTRLVNHFLVNGSWYLVDLPGYGYAKAPQKEREAIEAVIRDYLNHSEELRHLFILIDSRHPLMAADESFIREVGGSDIPFSIIFTKADKQSRTATLRCAEENIGRITSIIGADAPSWFVTSSEKASGKEEILNLIDTLNSNA